MNGQLILGCLLLSTMAQSQIPRRIAKPAPITPVFRIDSRLPLPTIKGVDHQVTMAVISPKIDLRKKGIRLSDPRYLKQMVRHLRSQNTAALKQDVERLITEKGWVSRVGTQTGVRDIRTIDTIVLAALQEAYMDSSKDLSMRAEKVKYFNELKKKIRSHLKELRGGRATDASGRVSVRVVEYNVKGRKGRFLTYDSRRVYKMADRKRSMTRKELENYISEIEEKLSQVGDDAQLANIDLQNWLQKQQQTLKMLSNVAKLLHDTAITCIRKIKG